MRRTISILLTALVAFGCAKEELAVLEPSRTTEASGSVGMSPISITLEKSAESWGTKASIVDGFAVGDAVTVAAFQGNDVCFSDAVAKTSSSWAMSEPHFWDIYDAEYGGSAYLDFCFVYPNQTISNKSFTYTVAANPADQEDLLVKHIHTQAPENYGAVEVVMDHALSILDFKVKAEESGYEYKVEGITVNNAAGFYDNGTYTFGSGWGSLSKVNSVNSISSPINVATVSSSEYTDVNDGDYCFLLPQDVASMGINVRYSVFKNGTTYTDTKSVSLSDNTFAAGKKYTYNVTLPKLPAVQLIPLSTPFVWTSSISQKELEFTWTCDDESLVGRYDIYWSTSGKPAISGSPNATTTSKTYTVNVGSNNTTCYFAVVAKPKAGDEEHEASDAGRTFATTSSKALAPPTIRVSDIGPDYIEFTWNAVDNANEYIIKDYSTGKDLDTITGTTFKWTGLNGGTRYTIGIVAKRKSDNKYDPSPEAYKSATTLQLAPWWGEVDGTNKYISITISKTNYPTEYGIIISKAKLLKVTFKRTQSTQTDRDLKIALHDSWWTNNPKIDVPKDYDEHVAYLVISEDFKTSCSSHDQLIILEVDYGVSVSKIEYAY